MSKNETVLACPKCKGRLSKKQKGLFCIECKKLFAIKEGIIDFLPEKKTRDVYEKIHSKKDPYSLEKNKGIALGGHEQKNKILKEIFSKIGIKGKVLLDIGTGPKINPLLQECKKGILLDISRNALENSIKGSNGKNFIFVLADEKLPVLSGSIDVVFCGEMIEHSRHPARLLEECYRAMKPDGNIVITTPNKKALLFALTFMEYGKDRQHVSLQSFGSMKKLLEKRFEITNCYGFNQSFWHYLDKGIKSKAIVEWWAKRFKHKPWLATGNIFECKKKTG